MKKRSGKLSEIVMVGLVWIGLRAVPPAPAADASAVKAVAETRQSLREQGFKTDLAEFDFSTSPELREREAALTNAAPLRLAGPPPDHANLLQPIGNDSAIVVWKLDSLKKEYPSWPNQSDQLTWEEFREDSSANQSRYDSACAAILSGPIRFNLNASHGSAMLLPHLAGMKSLLQTFGDRTVLALRDGQLATVWTNLMAASRLVTAYDPEPAEVSQLVRFACTTLAYNAVWQALQTNGWTDQQLAQLQHEWESVDFFSQLPETIAFKRAYCVADCERESSGEDDPIPPFSEFAKAAFRYPVSVWYELNHRWEQARFRQRGNFDMEKELMLFYRDREIEFRNAVKAPTWAAMKQLPSVTNYVPFQSNSRSRAQSLMNLRELTLSFQRQGTGFLGRAAEAESHRRLIVAALALERYRGQHGSYPNALASLAPEFLKTVPVDFMDGQPLRYRLNDDGHFLLYSVGLDCVDNGGKQRRMGREAGLEWRDRSEPRPEFDLVWPLPASFEAVQAQRKQEERTQELQTRREQERESEDEWKQSLLRQSRVAQILATKFSPVLDSGFFGGRSAAEFLRNTNAISNQISLAELLTPRQVLTGHEPEDLTFEFPVNYDAVTNHGFLLLLDADTDPGSMFAPDSGAKVQERSRAENGDCLLIWHTIFDPPGQHALQVELTWNNASGAETWCRGPAIAVTTSNLCQFSYDSSTYDTELGARFHARLLEKSGSFSIECLTTNGAHLTRLNGNTTNGEFNLVWNLVDDHGHRLQGETFNSIVHITLPDSGRTQTLRGP